MGDVFYVGDKLSNSIVLAAQNNLSGSFEIGGTNNIGVYGGNDFAVLPWQVCKPNCPVPNLVQNSAWLPNFSSINSSLLGASSYWQSQPANGSAILDPVQQSLTLTGTATDINVFNITAAQLEGATGLYVQVPPGASTVINVNGNLDCGTTPCMQFVDYWNGSGWEQAQFTNSPTVEGLLQNTVLNFYNASSVKLFAAGPGINILAPSADFSFNNGEMFGYVYANQVTGDYEDDLSSGFTVPSTTTTTSPSTTTTSVPSTTSSVPSTTSTTAPTTTTTPYYPPTVPTTQATTTTLATTTTTLATTTTTVPATTTTVPATTTTVPATTTTTVAPTTSTTVGTHAKSGTTTTTVRATTTTAPAATTTTVPATTTTAPAATTTTAPAATTTTAPAATTTTAPAATTTTAPAPVTTTTVATKGGAPTTTTTPAGTTTTTTTPKQLAFTGSNSLTLTGAGIALMLGGGVVVLAARKRRVA